MGALAAILSGLVFAAAAPLLVRLARGWAGWLLALLPAALTAFFALGAPAVWEGAVVLSSQPWVPALGVSLSFRLDGLSLLFTLLITGIGALVFVYAGGYLAGHPQLGRFFAFLLLFMASMLGLVLSDNLILLFVFWELTSISSYFLIGFQHEREQARTAALQALLVTGLGGLALLAGFVLLAHAGGSYEFSALLAKAASLRADPLYLPALLLILLGAFTKSAQFPFHFWLPTAMEAPTPVSAYLHAATMVKAGVYLLARLSPLLGGTEAWGASLTAVGAATMLAGAALALFKSDLKQILAYSTVSALGALTFLIGIGTPLALGAMTVYLAAHGLYKGALFLVAGAVDHATGTRDVHRLGRLARSMPITAAAALLAAFSMAGVPLGLGFVAKELLYESAMAAPRLPGLWTAVAVVAAAIGVTLASLAGIHPFFARRRPVASAHEGSLSMCLGPCVLAAGGLLLGLAPGLLEGAVRSIATAGQPSGSLELALFHGLNPALLLSLVSLLGGAGLYAAHRRIFAAGPALAILAGWGPAHAYDAALQALAWLAKSQTRILQSGYLRYYLLTVIGTAVGLAGFALWRSPAAIRPAGFSDVGAHELILVAVILAAILLAVQTSSRLTAVAALGVVGIGIALVFALFGAPDLAITQFVVESLTVVLLVLILHHVPDFSRLTPSAGRLRDALLAGAAGGLMTLLVLIGAFIQRDTSVAAYFLDHSVALAHGRNVVNVILTDFRALDTLGEITVLAVAGLGVYSLLRLRPRGKGEPWGP